MKLFTYTNRLGYMKTKFNIYLSSMKVPNIVSLILQDLNKYKR